jgi:hypothetical protein
MVGFAGQLIAVSEGYITIKPFFTSGGVVAIGTASSLRIAIIVIWTTICC